MKRLTTIIIALIIATLTFAMNSDQDVFGGNNKLRKFYVPQLFQVMSSSEAERYHGVDDVNVHNYVNLNRAYVILRKKALEYSAQGGFGNPIDRTIPYLGIIDGKLPENISKWLVNDRYTIGIVNFEKYRRMNQAWRYHDLFVYGANQIKGNQIDKSAPLIGINSPEARVLRIISTLYKGKHSSYLRLQNIINRRTVVMFDRTYNANKTVLSGLKTRDITDLYLRTMDLSWDLIPSRYVAAGINDNNYYITSGPEQILGETKSKTPAEVAHVPSLRYFPETNTWFAASQKFNLSAREIEEDSRIISSMIQNNKLRPLWNRWDNDLWDNMNQARKVLVVDISSMFASELYTWLRVLLTMKIITPRHMLAHLIVALAYQDIINNAAFIGKRAHVDYVIDAQIGTIPIYQKLYPHIKFIPFYREYNRLIRVSGGTPWLYYASVIASRYIWRGGATGIGAGFGPSNDMIQSRAMETFGRQLNFDEIQAYYAKDIEGTLNRTPNTMNQPSGGRASATGTTAAQPYADR